MRRQKSFRTLLTLALMLLSVAALNLPVNSAPIPARAMDVCETCEKNCYRDARNVADYNNCIRVICNYGLSCNLPTIE